MITILIVEDDATKLQRITRGLSVIGGVDVSMITRAGDVNTAKEYLKQNYYDLLILDIALPLRMDQDVRNDGGIRLLDEITERSGYRLPSHIVGVTAYPDILEIAAERFSQRLLTVLFYDPSSEDWATRLEARTKHIIAAKADSAIATRGFDSKLAIVCALETPELSSIVNIDWSWKQIHVPHDDSIYYEGHFHRDDRKKLVHAACAGRMGMTAAAILSLKMIDAFRPEMLAIVGITAGVPGKTKFGDVVVADPSWDWGNGKWEIRDEKLSFAAAPHQLPLSVGLRNKFKLLSNDAAALALIRQSWPGEKPEHELSVRVGPMASGAAVLADGLTVERVKQQHRDLLAIEMEAYGAFAAAEEAVEPRPIVFAMKSVVDFADGKKDDQFQRYGGYTSAQVLKCFLERYA